MTLIKNVNHIRQAIDFTGLQNDKIHPSDIDAVLEFNNEAVIFFELKDYKSAGIPTGQRLLLERLVNGWHNQKAVALEIRHNQLGEKPIDLSKCEVVRYYINNNVSRKWIDAKLNVKEALNLLGRFWDINKLHFK